MAVFLLVQRMEGLPDLLQPGLVQLVRREGHAQLVALADIAQVAGAAFLHPVGAEAGGLVLGQEVATEPGEVAVDPLDIDGALHLEGGHDLVVLEIGGEQARRGRDAGMGRDHDLGHVEHRRDLGAVQRPGTAEGDQREVARIQPLLHRLGADGVRHVRVDDGEHAFRRFVLVDAERLGEVRERPVRTFRRERHLAAEEVVGIQTAEHEVGVRHRRRVAAPAVAGGAGLGARALGSHLEGAARVDPRDAAAARADGGDVDHRHQHRVAADPGIARGGLVVVAVDHDADVGAGAAHVEGDEAPASRVLRRPGAAQHAGGRPRHEGDDRHVRHHRRGRDAAVGPHDVEIARDARLLQPVLEAAHVVAHLGADEGVHGRRGEALELAELRRDPGRGGDEGLRPLLQHDGPRAAPRAAGSM